VVRFCILFMALMLTGCLPAGRLEPEARIAVYGDSMMAWNGTFRKSTPDVLEVLLGEPVQNQAVTAARISNPVNPLLDIRNQYGRGLQRVAVVNGGANDMFFECGCGRCATSVDRLISEDGQSGEIPDFLRRLRADDLQVVFVGYHRSRGLIGPAKGCKNELDALDLRVAAFAASEPGVRFVSLQDVFPPGDPAYYALDRIHPSILGSVTIAKRLAPHVEDALRASLGG